MGQNGVFVEGLRGVRFKKSTFGVQKVHFLGILHPLKSILVMGLFPQSSFLYIFSYFSSIFLHFHPQFVFRGLHTWEGRQGPSYHCGQESNFFDHFDYPGATIPWLSLNKIFVFLYQWAYESICPFVILLYNLFIWVQRSVIVTFLM